MKKVKPKKLGEKNESKNGTPNWKVPELLFEKKRLIPALQQLIMSSKT